MATGAPGTNGVWQYGEDDSEATFSALLNKAASTTDTQIGADRTRLTALEANGRIVQVQSATKTDTFSTSSTSFTDVTSLSVSITPKSATNKIIVTVTTNAVLVSGVSAAYGAVLTVVRDSTNLVNPSSPGSRTKAISKTNNQGLAAGAYYSTPVNFTFLDSPATTSATTYKVQALSTGGSTLYVNRLWSDDDNANGVRFVSTITVMEVKA